MQSAKKFPVDVEPAPAALREALDRVRQLRPCGSITLVAPFGFRFRRDPDAFAFVATGTLLGMSLMLLEFAARVPRIALAVLPLSGVFGLAAVISLLLFLSNQLLSFEIRAADATLVVERRLAGFVFSRRVTPVESIVGIWVLEDLGSPRVVVAGPRHQLLGELFRARRLDPESLAPWIAEMVAFVARFASASLRQPPLAP